MLFILSLNASSLWQVVVHRRVFILDRQAAKLAPFGFEIVRVDAAAVIPHHQIARTPDMFVLKFLLRLVLNRNSSSSRLSSSGRPISSVISSLT